MISLSQNLNTSNYSNYYNGEDHSSSQGKFSQNKNYKSGAEKKRTDGISESLKKYLDKSNDQNQDENTIKKNNLENRIGEIKNEIELSKSKEEIQKDKAIKELQSIERKVIAHEMAHMSAGGKFAGSPTYSYQQGPDGKRYIVGGEVSISIQSGKTPEETMRNARQVKAAAMAPANPSPADLSVASQATAMEARASMELAQKRADQSSGKDNERDINETSINDSDDLKKQEITNNITDDNKKQDKFKNDDLINFDTNNMEHVNRKRIKKSNKIADNINFEKSQNLDLNKSDEELLHIREINEYKKNNDLKDELGSKLSIIA